MAVGRHLWRLREQLVGSDRVVTFGQLRTVEKSSGVGVRGKARLHGLLLRELIRGPASHARVRVGDAIVEIGDDGFFPVDWKAFAQVFGEQPYRSSYQGAAVLDVGAHKGYFGAYALAQGASIVISFEPALENFAALQRSAAALGGRWIARNCALGRAAGSGVLLLDRTSWAHSLVGVKRPAGEQPVTIATLAQALSELPGRASRTIVKVDAEGAECDILADLGPLARVDVLMVELHPAVAPCSEEELVVRMSSAGLERVEGERGALLFER